MGAMVHAFLLLLLFFTPPKAPPPLLFMSVNREEYDFYLPNKSMLFHFVKGRCLCLCCLKKCLLFISFSSSSSYKWVSHLLFVYHGPWFLVVNAFSLFSITCSTPFFGHFLFTLTHCFISFTPTQ